MNCKEAEQLFGIYWDMAPDDRRRIAVDQHVSKCPACATEFAIWRESQEWIQSEAHDLEMNHKLTMQSEQMNRNVMERIYAETPWVVQTDMKRGPILRMFRRRISFWIASLIAVFLCSFIYLTLDMSGNFSKEEAHKRVSGIVPIGVATGDSNTVKDSSLHFAGSERGLIDPLVIQMDPTHPQYWMILSIVGMLLAVFSLRWLAKTRHTSS